MEDPHTREEWRAILGGLIERNGGGEQYVYWQVTRGAEYGRNHAPLPRIERTVFAFCAPLAADPPAVLERGVSCVTATDTRWARCDIKSTALLANVLLRQLAVEADAEETILLRDGELTEASASSVHVVLGGEVLVPPNSRRILPGTTRSAIEELAARAGVTCRAGAGERGAAARRGRGVAERGDARAAAGDRARRARGRYAGARGRCGGACTRRCSATSRNWRARPGERAGGAAVSDRLSPQGASAGRSRAFAPACTPSCCAMRPRSGRSGSSERLSAKATSSPSPTSCGPRAARRSRRW